MSLFSNMSVFYFCSFNNKFQNIIFKLKNILIRNDLKI